MGEPLLAPALRSLAQGLHQEDGKGVALLLPFLLAGGLLLGFAALLGRRKAA
jgi:hypothetical protein